MTRSVILGSATAGLLALGAVAAVASGPPYTITVGSAASGSFGTALQTSTPTTATVGPSTLTCSSLAASGSTAAGPGLTPITTIASAHGPTCTIDTLFGDYHVSQIGTATVRGTGNTASSATTDVVQATVSDLRLRLIDIQVPQYCSFTITGTVAARFDERKQRIVVSQKATSSFVATDVTGCAGQIPAGPVGVATTLDLTVPTPAGAAVRLS